MSSGRVYRDLARFEVAELHKIPTILKISPAKITTDIELDPVGCASRNGHALGASVICIQKGRNSENQLPGPNTRRASSCQSFAKTYGSSYHSFSPLRSPRKAKTHSMAAFGRWFQGCGTLPCSCMVVHDYYAYNQGTLRTGYTLCRRAGPSVVRCYGRVTVDT